MRPVLSYTLARIGLFAVSAIVLYLVGLRDILLLAVALVVSGIASYVLLSKQRDAISEKVTRRVNQSKPSEEV